jgi:hypothetical protein
LDSEIEKKEALIKVYMEDMQKQEWFSDALARDTMENPGSQLLVSIVQKALQDSEEMDIKYESVRAVRTRLYAQFKEWDMEEYGNDAFELVKTVGKFFCKSCRGFKRAASII